MQLIDMHGWPADEAWEKLSHLLRQVEIRAIHNDRINYERNAMMSTEELGVALGTVYKMFSRGGYNQKRDAYANICRYVALACKRAVDLTVGKKESFTKTLLYVCVGFHVYMVILKNVFGYIDKAYTYRNGLHLMIDKISNLFGNELGRAADKLSESAEDDGRNQQIALLLAIQRHGLKSSRMCHVLTAMEEATTAVTNRRCTLGLMLVLCQRGRAVAAEKKEGEKCRLSVLAWLAERGENDVVQVILQNVIRHESQALDVAMTEKILSRT